MQTPRRLHEIRVDHPTTIERPSREIEGADLEFSRGPFPLTTSF
jgi:hypothetical protein